MVPLTRTFQVSIVKHYKISNLPYWQRKQYSSNSYRYALSMMYAAMLGTYLDLLFTGLQFYSFPERPFSAVFQIHIVFTLVILPFLSFFFLYVGKSLKRSGRVLEIIFLAAAGPVLEMVAESYGLFLHTNEWKHWYSFAGYFLFWSSVWFIFRWTNGDKAIK
ncbi:CBO0543 family protein [Siminovitchia sediminis]|uniref:CBO0543 family protein n=1 Tax=Siminovitchia sediminis TaxID=1274353 RepID=A0ABW4KHM3_9BACI